MKNKKLIMYLLKKGLKLMSQNELLIIKNGYGKYFVKSCNYYLKSGEYDLYTYSHKKLITIEDYKEILKLYA